MKLLYIDLFCGAGGTSTGVENARYKGEQCAKVIACVNHDFNAIASHAANHPDALHFTEDIRTLELSPLVSHTEQMRQGNPNAFVVLWASLECTNFSKAKGGQPRDADSRTLAEHLFRYIEAVNPDYIQIENVEEFMSWGDLDANGKPMSKDKGRSYINWVNQVKRHGYNYDYRILNSADFGAYTSRKRFFGIFAKDGLPIVFPEQTHAPKSKIGGNSSKVGQMQLTFDEYQKQFQSAGGSIDNPCFTLIARMDKMPPYLVATETGIVCIEVYDTGSPMTAKIKEFMAIYGIVDIKMRMLKIPELKRIMGFPEDYTLIGTQAEQKKFIGNAVEVNMARVLCEALCAKLYELNINPLKIAA